MYFTLVNHKPKKGWGERRRANPESTQHQNRVLTSQNSSHYIVVYYVEHLFSTMKVSTSFCLSVSPKKKVICLFLGKIFVTENKKKSTTPLACSRNYFNIALSLHLPSYKSNWAIQIVLVKECMGKGGYEENPKRVKLMGERIKSPKANPSGSF